MKLKIVTPLAGVKVDSVVTKIGGTVEYYVKKQIKFYEHTDFTTVNADEGCCFLVGAEGSINAVPLTKEVIWHTDLDTLNELHDLCYMEEK